MTDSGAIKFGIVGSSYENVLLDIPAAIVIGIVCGLLGAFFIHFTCWSGMQRKKYVNTPVKKVCEAAFMAFITATAFYCVVISRSGGCHNKEGSVAKELEEEFRFTCPYGEYNPLATLVFNTEGGTIR